MHFWLCCTNFLIPSFSYLSSIVSMIFRILSAPLWLLSFVSFHLPSQSDGFIFQSSEIPSFFFSGFFFYLLNLPFEVYFSCLFHFNFESTHKNLKYFLFYILSSLTSTRGSAGPRKQNEVFDIAIYLIPCKTSFSVQLG